jgi:outer membrane receptor protein involved in Fe transport
MKVKIAFRRFALCRRRLSRDNESGMPIRFRAKRRTTRVAVSLCAALLAVLPALPAHAAIQAPTSSAAATPIAGTVVDAQGLPVSGARVLASNGQVLAVTDSGGAFHASLPPGAGFQVAAAGFATVTVANAGSASQRVVLHPGSEQESIEVTAYRSPLPAIASPASTRILTQTQLQQAATPALDGKLRMVPGLELFRRSSSLVANPTSQGISLRGLGSTAASRTLVVSDDVPLNDPYGGWIHWEEPAELAIQSVEVVRGGASDLYGSSAIGGVVNVISARPHGDALNLLGSYGSENTTDDAVFGSLHRGAWGGLISGGVLDTDGYTLVAPQFRGPVDVNNNVHAENGIAYVERSFASTGRVFLRGTGFNEARSNGTPLTNNGTRLWRYAMGMDWTDPSGGTLGLRLYGSTESYRQTFSAVAPGRVSESLTRSAETPADELGAVAHWSQPLGPKLVLLAGADTHDVRAHDSEALFKTGASNGALNITARQRQTGVYGEALWTPERWTLSASMRVDHFSNFDARQFNTTSDGAVTPTAYPDFSETVADPRLGLARRITENFALTASAFRAYRAPTQNELYRTGQVGQQVTQANAELRSERATGWETGFQMTLPQHNATLRASYFWTRVNRPITALTLSVTPTQTLLKRENLGQIESRGIALDYEFEPVRWMMLTGGYQFANATVTAYAQQPQLVGNWIPQVARNMATTQVRLSKPKYGTLGLEGRISGRQFDDDANRYLLHSYFRLDAYLSHQFGKHLELFASGENLFDRAIEVGRTPVLTLGTPLIGRFGFRIHTGD